MALWRPEISKTFLPPHPPEKIAPLVLANRSCSKKQTNKQKQFRYYAPVVYNAEKGGLKDDTGN